MPFPMLAGALHYMKICKKVYLLNLDLVGGYQSITTSYEMHRLGKKTKQFKMVFEDLNKALLSYEPLKEYIIDETTLLIYDPKFEDYQFRQKGIVNTLYHAL